ncbi:Sensor histidine kinase ResE [anaerobic digester metagenome]|uniref:sensor histidine kinase n=1 Tax=Oscillibacter ruminantium TaxID=1263547 RepID=UPI0002D414E6|nr:ATP-binding protein [Oscillibacter ruminantium]
MTKRIFRSILVVSLAALLAALALVVGVLHGYFESRTEADLNQQAVTIARGTALGGIDYFEGLNISSRVTWVGQDGTVLYDNWQNASTMENHASREEIQEAMSLGKGTAVRWSDTLGQTAIYCAVRLDDGTVVRAASTQYSVWALVLQSVQPILVVVIAAMILAAMLASRLSKSIVRPINELDLNNPGGTSEDFYEELTPLLTRLRMQNHEIRQQMDQLRRRQEEFSAITENMSEGFLVLDIRTRVLSNNSAALRLLETDCVPVPGETSAFVLSREEGFRRCVEEALAGRRSERMVRRETLCRQIIASPVMQDGHLGGAVVVILDVTEREQRESLRREFTANVSHELKTPLTAISGTAEILENGMVKPEDVGHFAGNIHREAGRLIELVNDIIKLSRLDEGGADGPWEEMDLYRLSKNVLEQVRPAAEKRNLTLSLKGGPAMACGVPQILEEIVYNLCDNAVAYNRDGGSVTVTVEDTGKGARLTVEDTGVGIPAEARDRVFERFYRVDKSHSRGGTGLGLSIVKHGAAYLGATVVLRSEVGTGSTFILNFPPAEH